MRTWLSVAVIVFSLAALVGGYIGGRSSVTAQTTPSLPSPVDARSVSAPLQFARSLHGMHSFAAADEAPPPSDEEAVVSNDPGTGTLGDNATVAIVIENAGPSLKLESGFLNMPVPMTFAVDPAADEASEVAAAAFDRGKTVYILLEMSPSQTKALLQKRIAHFRSVFPAMSGVAVHFDQEYEEREATVLAQALRDEHLHVLDLTGLEPAAERVLHTGGIVSRRRDVTIDNRDEAAYVGFMLAQAVQVARGRGTAVIVAHPYPGSLDALSTLVDNSARDGVNFTVL
jgi:polysaccharide deacetylase 2 family uncharacterized protein YibQ